MPRIPFAVCVSAFLLVTAAPAFARDVSRTISYGELNLEDASGADTLIRRVENAADFVCGDYRGQQSVADQSNFSTCEVATTQRAISDIAHPVVTARYYGRRPDVTIEGSWDPEADHSYVVRPVLTQSGE
jgi:UrcA family protein